MQQFRISATGISQLTRKGFYKSFSIVLFALAALFVMGPLNVDTGEIKVTPLLFAIPVLLGIMIFSIIRSNNRLKQVLTEYSILLDQNSITRRQAQTPELHMPFADISGIYQKRDGIIIVAGRHASDMIVVMPELEGYGQLVTILQQIQPFSPLPKETLFQLYPIHTALTALAIMIVFYMSHHKVVLLCTGIPLILLAGWAIYKLWSLRGTKSTLRRSTWAFMAILLVIIGSVALKLSTL